VPRRGRRTSFQDLVRLGKFSFISLGAQRVSFQDLRNGAGNFLSYPVGGREFYSKVHGARRIFFRAPQGQENFISRLDKAWGILFYAL